MNNKPQPEGKSKEEAEARILAELKFRCDTHHISEINDKLIELKRECFILGYVTRSEKSTPPDTQVRDIVVAYLKWWPNQTITRGGKHEYIAELFAEYYTKAALSQAPEGELHPLESAVPTEADVKWAKEVIRKHEAGAYYWMNESHPQAGEKEERLTENEWAVKSGFLALAIRKQELEIEIAQLKSQSQPSGIKDETLLAVNAITYTLKSIGYQGNLSANNFLQLYLQSSNQKP